MFKLFNYTHSLTLYNKVYRTMNLDSKLADLAIKTESIKNSVTEEEVTKNTFVLPILIVIGYDGYNPFELIHEMDCKIIKKGR